MEGPQPMDRLLCGDVGYGKTEVVMRAAFKALGDGKQVAVLAPTTVLAFQHFETFKRRFQPFPVRVEMFSRFRSPKEIKAGLADLAEGKVDIAIGTHRLLSQDVRIQGPGPGDRGRRAALRREAQRAPQAAQEIGRSHQHERHSDPQNTTHVVIGSAGHVGDRDSAQGSPLDPHRSRAVSAGIDPLRHGAGAGSRRPSLFPPQPGGFHLDARRDDPGTRADGAHRRRTRPDGRGGTGENHARSSCGTSTISWFVLQL